MRTSARTNTNRKAAPAGADNRGGEHRCGGGKRPNLWGGSILLLVAIGLLAAAPARGALIATWSFDGDASDATGHGHDGTLFDDAGFSSNVPSVLGAGQSLALDGTNDHVQIPADPALDSAVFTLTCWVNQNGASQNGTFERITSRDSNSFETAIGSGTSGSVRFYPAGGSWHDTGYDVPTDGWSHLAWVSDGSEVLLFADGAQVDARSAVLSPTGSMLFAAQAADPGDEAFEGLLDDIALWDEVLAPATIGALADGSLRPMGTIPEPTAATLLALAALGLLGWRRRTGGDGRPGTNG